MRYAIKHIKEVVYKMIRSIIFILLAVALTFESYTITTLSVEPLFCYGVAFIGYSVASLLTLVAVFIHD